MAQTTQSSVPAENAPKISVVVPVYKVEKFVAECLESILAQDFDSFEVVAVDDGSPDASGKICDEFAARDPRLRVFHKENGGVVAARKLGVARSRGEWICFVDSDDVLLPRALSVLFAATQQFPETDIVEGGNTYFRDDIREATQDRDEQAVARNLFTLAGDACAVVTDGLAYAKNVASGRLFFSHAVAQNHPQGNFVERQPVRAPARNQSRERHFPVHTRSHAYKKRRPHL